MRLQTFERRLRARLLRAERAFTEAAVLSQHKDRHLRRHGFEGALSDAWQAYCDFSREVCIHSSIGAMRGNGVPTVASINPATPERASHIAIRSVIPAAPQPNAINATLLKEPTWGDSNKINLIIAALNPTNAAQLQAYFFGGLVGPKHCQIVRNAAAHKNHQTLASVQDLAVNYVAGPIVRPTDALTWTDTSTKGYAFISWLDDMRTIAAGAVQ